MSCYVIECTPESMANRRDDQNGSDSSKVLSLEGSVPSKRRDVIQNALFGAPQNQPSGKALQTLILGQWGTPCEHFDAAKHVNPTEDLINVALAQKRKLIILNCAKNPDSVVAKRTYAREAVRGFSNKLESTRSLWTRSLPGRSPARTFRSALILSLTSHLDYEGGENFPTSRTGCR